MKKAIVFLFATLITFCSFSQNFEGKIVYKNSFTSKMPGVSDEQFTNMMGAANDYFIKDGNYKMTSNGSLFQWMVYINKENRIYSKMANSEELLWNDASEYSDEVIKSEINKGVVEILGYLCDELVLTCKSGTQKFYFSSKLTANAAYFTNHNYGNWKTFLAQSGTLPLKTIVENENFTSESIAIEIKEMKLEDSFFHLPAGAKSVKSPY